MTSVGHLEMDNLAGNLIYLRNSNGISKRGMADIMGVGVWTLNKLELGELPPRMKVEALFRIQERFGVPVHRLLGERIE